jgi:hypothetical protein
MEIFLLCPNDFEKSNVVCDIWPYVNIMQHTCRLISHCNISQFWHKNALHFPSAHTQTHKSIERSKFVQILGILINVLKQNLVQSQSQLKIYNILTIPSFLHSCEICTLKHIRRLKTAEEKFMRHAAG